MVTGVIIMADFLIYRNDRQLGDHYVKFSPQTIWAIRNKFFKNGFNVNTNVQHATMVQGAILVESFIVDSKNPRAVSKVPEILSSQNVTDGSWVGTYHIENEQLWQDCKNGVFKGFSVEGYFDKKQVNVKSNNTNMSKKTGLQALLKQIFGEAEEMKEVTAVDGTVLSFEGDLAVGTQVNVTVDGKPTPAPAGDYQVEIDGKTFALTLDADGKVSTMEEAEAMSDEAEVLLAAIAKLHKDNATKFAAMQSTIDTLSGKLSAIEKGEKYVATGKNNESVSTGASNRKKLLGK
jgi:hypothetical protein